MRPFALLIGLFLCVTVPSLAQDRPTIDLNDSTEVLDAGKKVSSVIPPYVPRKALLYSAIFPGLGQAYNGKFWKVPIVYGGFIGMGYLVSYYSEVHNEFKFELFKSIQDPSYVSSYGIGVTQLRTVVDQLRRERDYMMVLTGVFYLLQIADAHIDAHLREFDLNPEMQVSIEPSMSSHFGGQIIGMGIKLKF